MFYSHNLLARKEPLGQIWMAATTHAKINRRKLNKLNIIKICEEILNPPVPMALRLSGILMGGVVIVYERKVKLLRDDVNRLLAEINEAWKVKAARDPTLLPKGKCQAKKEAVTLPENGDADIEDDEHPPHAMFFQQTAYFSMGLDSVEIDAEEGFPSERFHQVEAKDITIEHTDSYHASANLCNHFERFDIDDNEDVLMDVTHPQIPESLIPSPPHSDDPQRGPPVADKVHNQNHEHTAGQLSDGYQDIAQAEQRLGPIRRKTRRTAASIMDCEQTIIPGHVYQSWLQDASDIISRRRKIKRANLLSTMKIANLMELPPTVLVNNLFTAGGEIYYPHPLLELWKKSIEPSHGEPSGSFSPPRPLEPVSSTPFNHQEPIGFSFDGTWDDQVQIDEPTEVTFRSKKRPHLFPSARISSSSLEPIEEENAWNSPGPNFKVARRSGLTPDYEVEILMETGPTQTQQQIFNDSVDSITDSIRMQMKAHFDTPGAPQVESLNNLAAEMNRKGAAQLFYHTCVLATRNFLKVEQEKPYGEILISKGSKI